MNNYEYDATPYTTEIFLSDAPVDLAKSRIKEQFMNNDNHTRYDYFGQYIENYQYAIIRTETEEDTISLERVNDMMIKFMIDTFNDYLGIGFPDIEDRSISEQHEILHMCYRYFIINMMHNFISYCRYYIDNNKSDLVNSSMRSKDVTSLNLKKDSFDPDDIAIIASLHTIIEKIIRDTQIDGLDEDDRFIQWSDYDEPMLETDLFSEYYDGFIATGAFVQKYCTMVSTNMIREIESIIRQQIFAEHVEKG